ncbi:YajQ family cyclic di-GMP-binding protein [Paenibacillus sp. MWE-103]|uniref:Nucleotide-binding protein I8J29_20420 n=1 Tax=Paenibacillus artemisiicola TaxID=1172618 RepID=A0ABS3WE26_9BACL|nr:YajQ family cyclic di-GMP-binding protein [Paenibacillus artemisiicola]MBO7746585.1 YajQ family cyclic di-GMP-binding protein [Paenibacillus artemisiicola]
MAEHSFDIVSKVDMQELSNAITQAEREIDTRFDFKGTKTSFTLEKTDLVVVSDDEYKLKNVIDILQSKMMKRGVPIKNMEFGKVEAASMGTVRQKVKLKQGIEQDSSKKINTLIRDSKIKVKSQIQGDSIRVTGKSLDDLQAIIALLRGADLQIDLQFTNYK